MSQEGNDGQRRELISFRIGGQEYCVDIVCVREIRGWTAVTTIPHASPSVMGVINLRGQVMPVIDLKHRLGLGATEANERNVIIVAQIADQVAGLLVDEVCETLSATQAELQPAPEISGGSREFVKGFLMLDGRMITLLSLTPILLANEDLVVEAA